MISGVVLRTVWLSILIVLLGASASGCASKSGGAAAAALASKVPVPPGGAFTLQSKMDATFEHSASASGVITVHGARDICSLEVAALRNARWTIVTGDAAVGIDPRRRVFTGNAWPTRDRGPEMLVVIPDSNGLRAIHGPPFESEAHLQCNKSSIDVSVDWP